MSKHKKLLTCQCTGENSRLLIIVNYFCFITSCSVVVSPSLHHEGLFFFLLGVMSCRISPPFRLKVQHIPGCTGQYDFNLFSQAAQTQTLRHNRAWNSCTTSLAETFSLSLWTKPRGKSRVASASCVPHVLTVKTCGPGFVKLRKCF